MKNSNAKDTLESMSQAVWYNQWTLNKFKVFLSGEILEVGCGIGNFTSDLAKYGEVWAIDINKEYVEQAKNRVADKAKIGSGDIEKGEYFFNNKKFDTVICLNVLEHVKEDMRAVNNLYNLLKKGGKLILLVPVHRFLYGEIDRSIGHFRRYDKNELTKGLKKSGFKIIFSRSINFLGALGWFLTGKILQKKIVGEGNIKIFNLLAPVILSAENLIEPPIGTSIIIVAQKE